MLLLHGADFPEQVRVLVVAIVVELAGVGRPFGHNLNGRNKLARHEKVPVEALQYNGNSVHNRTPENQANLSTAVATVTQLAGEAKAYTAQLNTKIQ